MSLFSSLNLAKLSLTAHQAAIQTVGQNIANAATEGYARQRVEFRPTPADDLVFARLGTGVRIDRIERIVDEHLEGTLRESRSHLGAYAEQNRIYTLAGSIFNDLDGGGLSLALGRFFDSLQDLADTPEDPTTRNQAVEEGRTLAETFRFLDSRVRDLRTSLDEDVSSTVQELNRIITEVAALNREIVVAEDGGLSNDTANDLRTRRDALLGRLSDLTPIKVIENDRGAVQVISGSDVLVYDGRARTIDLIPKSDGDISYHELRFADDGKGFHPVAGRLASLLEGRDEIAVDLRTELDTMAAGLLGRMNELHAMGEGVERLSFARSANAVVDRTASLAEAGYPFEINDGRFEMVVVAEPDGIRETYTLTLDLDGEGGDDTTLEDLVDQINTLVGADHPELSAAITADGYLEIRSASESLSFTFRNDETGFLRAAGIHTFFTGTSARDIAVSDALIDNPLLVTTGLGGGAGDNRAVQEMLGLRDEGLLGPSAMTFEQFYGALIGSIGIAGAEARDLLENQEAITQNVRNQREALSGVSIDEEAITLIQYQRAYQGSARFLSVVDRLLETLINSV